MPMRRHPATPFKSKPADRSARARPGREPGRDRREDGVPRRVPQAIVDLLEPVGVDHDHGRVIAVTGQEPAGACGVGVAAQQTGQRVAAARGDLLVQGDGVYRPAGQRQGGGGQ